jgi:hypothetical protein
MATLIGIALLFALFGVACAADALMENALLKLASALIERVPFSPSLSIKAVWQAL